MVVLQNKSFTIIESLIAIFILTVAFTAVTQIFPLNFKIDKSSEMKTKAIELIQAKMEEMNSKSYDEINCGGSSVPCTQTENQVAEDVAFKRVTTIKFADPKNNFQEPSPTTTDTGLKKITIVVSWKSTWRAGAEDSVQIVSLIAKK